MHVVHTADLPFVGMSRHFVGADQGDVAVSAYLVTAPPGRGSVPHTHPYDEIAFVQEGRGVWTVDGVEQEAGPGDILVVKAGRVHWFVNTGTEPLRSIGLHLAPRFSQQNLEQGQEPTGLPSPAVPLPPRS